MASIETFQGLRPRLVSLAYRMLGSPSDAEDVVQEAWLRWQGVEEATVQSPSAWLSATVSRLCLDQLKSARVRREAYVGTWLPEPVATEKPIDRESISLAFLVLLERLTPVERAVYLLHQVFDYAHGEIAAALEMSDAAVRQTFHRAREHVALHRPRFAPSAEEHARVLAAFAQTVVQGNLAALQQLLADDATLWADGGGKVRGAATRAVHGSESVARFLAGLAPKLFVGVELAFEIREVNGWPALVVRGEGGVVAVMNIETDGQKIVAIRNVVNPDKLALPTVD
ncbi:MAG: polymerase sigma-70 factor, subfamily [Myxococcales bacterium]|nr:polymerase sigma-70 factor, subfamily [Myxococcales bacterium]